MCALLCAFRDTLESGGQHHHQTGMLPSLLLWSRPLPPALILGTLSLEFALIVFLLRMQCRWNHTVCSLLSLASVSHTVPLRGIGVAARGSDWLLLVSEGCASRWCPAVRAHHQLKGFWVVFSLDNYKKSIISICI